MWPLCALQLLGARHELGMQCGPVAADHYQSNATVSHQRDYHYSIPNTPLQIIPLLLLKRRGGGPGAVDRERGGGGSQIISLLQMTIKLSFIEDEPPYLTQNEANTRKIDGSRSAHPQLVGHLAVQISQGRIGRACGMTVVPSNHHHSFLVHTAPDLWTERCNSVDQTLYTKIRDKE